MLVVTDELTGRVGRQRRLAGTGKTEEEADIPRLADIGTAVHGEDVV